MKPKSLIIMPIYNCVFNGVLNTICICKKIKHNYFIFLGQKGDNRKCVEGDALPNYFMKEIKMKP